MADVRHCKTNDIQGGVTGVGNSTGHSGFYVVT